MSKKIKNKKKLVIPCLRGVVGNWVYYSTMLGPSQISEWIEPAKQIRETKSLDDQLQRFLKDRQGEIAKYLTQKDNRFFNSIIVGVYGGIPDWHEFEIETKLLELGGSLDFAETTGLLEFKGDERMFAVDGQHRVAGIQYAHSKKLYAKTDNDKYPVLFIAHIDDEIGKKRTRQLFSDINQKIVAVPKKDRIIIDEEDLVHITTRRVFSEYKRFNKGKLIDVDSTTTNMESGNIEHFTNLTNLAKVISKLRPLHSKEKGSQPWKETNVSDLKQISFDFFDFVIENISEYKRYFTSKTLTLKTARKDNKYLLFRPIGISILARIYTDFVKSGDIDLLSKNITKLSFICPKSPFNKIIWNNGRIDSKNEALAFNLAMYIFNRKIKKTKPQLLRNYRDAVKDENAELPVKILE